MPCLPILISVDNTFKIIKVSYTLYLSKTGIKMILLQAKSSLFFHMTTVMYLDSDSSPDQIMTYTGK